MNKQEATAPAGDGWAAMERLRETLNNEREYHINKPNVLRDIYRELAARPAKEPGLTSAETEKHMATLCDETVSDEDAEVAEWVADAKSDPLWGNKASECYLIGESDIDAAVRIMRERGAALREMTRERDVYRKAKAERAEKAEAEVARLCEIIARIKEAAK